MKENRWLLYCGIVGVSFWWTGSAYISQAYRLLRFYPPARVDVLTQVLYYAMQVLGLAAYSLLTKTSPKLVTGRRFLTGVILVEAVVVPIAILAGSPSVVLVAGYVMNLLHGAVAGCYLAQLSSLVPGQHRGKAFGVGYAAGSLGSWLVSLPNGGEFLHSDGVVVVYWLLMGVTLVLLRFAGDPLAQENPSDREPASDPRPAPDPRPDRDPWSACDQHLFHDKGLWITIGIAIILLTITRTVGFYFPLADISGIVKLETSRVYYGLGLVIAGLINDRSRR